MLTFPKKVAEAPQGGVRVKLGVKVRVGVLEGNGVKETVGEFVRVRVKVAVWGKAGSAPAKVKRKQRTNPRAIPFAGRLEWDRYIVLLTAKGSKPERKDGKFR